MACQSPGNVAEPRKCWSQRRGSRCDAAFAMLLLRGAAGRRLPPARRQAIDSAARAYVHSQIITGEPLSARVRAAFLRQCRANLQTELNELNLGVSWLPSDLRFCRFRISSKTATGVSRWTKTIFYLDKCSSGGVPQTTARLKSRRLSRIPEDEQKIRL